MNRSLRIRAQENPSLMGISLWGFTDRDARGPNEAVTGLEMGPYKELQPLDPFVTIDRTAAQHLLDDLWNAGLRPAEVRTAGEHLTDLRKIAFAALRKIGVDVGEAA